MAHTYINENGQNSARETSARFHEISSKIA